MKMKKILIGISVFAITASLFSGCASQTPVETSSIATSDTSSTTTAETSSTTATEPTTENEAPVSSAESESKAETIEASTVETPATEETIGINEDEVRAHGKEWYEKYKEKVVCDEQTFVDHFTSLVIESGAPEEEAALETYTLYAKIELVEPEDGVINIPNYPTVDGSKPAQTEATKPSNTESKPAETTKPEQTTKPEETNKPTETTKPTGTDDNETLPPTYSNDYSNIKWGDPIPNNMTNNWGKKAKEAKWVEKPGGKFVKINGGYYRSIQDWAEGKPALRGDDIDGVSWEDYISDPNNKPIEWQ